MSLDKEWAVQSGGSGIGARDPGRGRVPDARRGGNRRLQVAPQADREKFKVTGKTDYRSGNMTQVIRATHRQPVFQCRQTAEQLRPDEGSQRQYSASHYRRYEPIAHTPFSQPATTSSWQPWATHTCASTHLRPKRRRRIQRETAASDRFRRRRGASSARGGTPAGMRRAVTSQPV